MPSRRRSKIKNISIKALKKWALISSFYGFSTLVLIVGLGICLTKPPTLQAAQYIAAAQYYQEHFESGVLSVNAANYILEQRYDALSKAAVLTPYDPEIWKLLVQVGKEKEIQAQISSAYSRPHALVLSRNDLDMSTTQ